MSNFNEQIFLYALTVRPEDAKRFTVSFKPEWLRTAEYVPLLAEIFAFTREYKEQPSLATLHRIFKDKDPEAYDLRYKAAIQSIEAYKPDRSEMVYTLDKARDHGIVRDFQELTNEQSFLRMQADLSGRNVLLTLHKFFTKHGLTSEDRTMDIKEAVEHLIKEHGWNPESTKISCGIKQIDKFTDGGLRRKDFGIIMAPTGEGKSTVLCIMAHRMATIGNKKVWFVTNELSIEQQTERMLACLTGKPVRDIIEDPGVAIEKSLDTKWRADLHSRLRLTEINREVSMDELEAEMMKWVNLTGWKPDVLVLDFIERMKPCERGYARDRVWDWLGAVSRDLSRFCKRHDILCWTAAQTNRTGYARGKKKKDPMSLEMAQSSTQHLQESSAIIGMRQHDISNDEIALEMADLKQRFAKRAAKPVFVRCDLGRMYISEEEWDPEDEMAVTASKPPKKQDLLTVEDKRKQRNKR